MTIWLAVLIQYQRVTDRDVQAIAIACLRKNCNRVNGTILKANQIDSIRAVLFAPCRPNLWSFPVPRPYTNKPYQQPRPPNAKMEKYGVYMPSVWVWGHVTSKRDCDSSLSQKSAVANGRYCHVMYKLLYPSIRVRTAHPVSVTVRTRVSVSFSLRTLFCICGSLR